MKFPAKTAGDVMSEEVISVISDESLLNLDNTLRAAGIGGVPVIDDETLVGIVSLSDVARHGDADLSAVKVADVMMKDVDTVTPQTLLPEVAARMLLARHRRLVVMEDDLVVGIITASDLVALIRDEWGVED